MNSNVDQYYMKRALKLAARGQGLVEPNPMVGCVVVRASNPDADESRAVDDFSEEDALAQIVGEGWHERFGGPHAEVNALAAAGDAARGATMYVTLEPCSHFGKTPPCADAVIAAGVARVVVAMLDPFPEVAGRGVEKLVAAGIDVKVGVLESKARDLNAPYLTRLEKGRPWIIAKWAMTLDGKIATRVGSSYWISSEESRAKVHELRERVDAILIGSRTAMEDDPRLTVRLPDGRKPKRVPTRIVLDSGGTLSVFSELALTARDAPLLLVFGPQTPVAKKEFWESKGAEVIILDAPAREQRIVLLMENLAKRGMTNVLVEGGGELLGHLFDLEYIYEVNVYVAPKIVGGKDAVVPVGGVGRELMRKAATLRNKKSEIIGPDIMISGRINY
ncbi:MAG: bifunctional diaminohydroxyphosphoribosylaminopyrimidine deaminase/5-amino-6-(5-phosphoribosylamino)uracil reductase RibD [Thermoguttaceae bacterium]|nr:bifunctional diaminohydroxyphosphoribosylaminopyrimidine deaminase/5-amino-6-(5-phosphoribosylamino)uracil reductase RibD [Thermoguttaceae bacterium]